MIHRFDILCYGFLGASGASALLFGPGLLSLGLPLALFAAFVTDGVARPGSSVLYPTITRGSRDGRNVALSFDDGPDPEATPRILDALAAAQMKATFFVIGNKLEQNPQIAERIVREGHELGNHTYRHSRLQNFFGEQRQQEQIRLASDAIRRFDPDARQPLFRPPVGLKNPWLARAAAREGVTIVAWSLHSRDTLMNEPDALARRVLARIRAGDIVLMHDGHDLPGRHRPASAAALPRILEGLAERNMRSVTISELIARDRQQNVERKLA